MALKDILKQIDGLQTKINSFGKLKKEVLNKINYKFRLDWNYNSNAMEGNSLTREETRTVMVNLIKIDERSKKDVLEIMGHDSVVTEILKIGKGELHLTEKRIKDIHKSIMYEDNPENKDKIGRWKTVNNHLINYKGEKHDFVPHEEVQERMHALINWLNKHYDLIKNGKVEMHPALLAFHFHVVYVSIHPFYDGNGRTARIFTNLILVALGFPPIIIKVEDKNTYNQYLADIQGYGGSPDLFLEFMCKQLIHSQEIVLNAIEGKEIEEPEDLDKKISLLEKELSGLDPDNDVKLHFNNDVFIQILKSWASELILKVIPVAQKFNKFFTGTHHALYIQNGPSVSFVNEPAQEILDKLSDEFKKSNRPATLQTQIIFIFNYGTLSKGGLNTFGCNYGITIHFDNISYYVSVDEFTEEPNAPRTAYKFKERLLHQAFTSSDIEQLKKRLGDTIFKHIDFYTKERGIR